MAEQLDIESLRALKAQCPDHTVVAYINTTSELKTECDVCVTSSSAVQIFTTLMDVYNCLKGGSGEEIKLPQNVMDGAGRCIRRMVELGG